MRRRRTPQQATRNIGQEQIDIWRRDCNHERPDRALGGRTRHEFAALQGWASPAEPSWLTFHLDQSRGALQPLGTLTRTLVLCVGAGHTNARAVCSRNQSRAVFT